jgi:hypothetical protein
MQDIRLDFITNIEPDEMRCDHEYTLTSGFACTKCGHNVIKDGGADDNQEENKDYRRGFRAG